MADKAKPPVSELFDQALKNYEQTLRMGLKLQEEASRWWTNLANQASSVPDWQKRVTAATNEIIGPSQKRMEEYLGLIEQNNRTSLDLLKKALEAVQTTGPTEWQGKCIEFWEASLNLVQSNAQSLTQMNNKMIDSWVAFVKKNSGDFGEPTVAKS